MDSPRRFVLDIGWVLGEYSSSEEELDCLPGGGNCAYLNLEAWGTSLLFILH